MAIYNTTKAVNLMLSSINEAPIDNIATTDFDLALQALAFLDTARLDMLAIGWAWNRRVLKIAPNNDGHIILPSDTMRIEQVSVGRFCTLLGNKLFDTNNNTYVFKETVEMVVIVELAYDELPYLAQRYVAVKAAKPFQMEKVGSVEKNAELSKDELTAITLLQSDEFRTSSADYNMVNHDFGMVQAESNRRWYY